MSSAEFELMREKITAAKHPEDLFGRVDQLDDPMRAALGTYRILSKLTHPDLHPEGEEVFKRLSVLWAQAQEKLREGTYGQIPPEIAETILIKTRHREYEVLGLPTSFGYANLYKCQYQLDGLDQKGILKIVKDPVDNDLAENEARVLRELKDRDEFDLVKKYYPDLVDSFIYRDSKDPIPRQSNVFSKDDYKYVTLEEIRDGYIDGIDPKDAAWIWRRLLVGLDFAHKNKIINGSILPSNILIQPENHGVVISEWSYAVMDPANSFERINAIDLSYESWFPKEVLNKDLPTPALDIYMAAKNIVYLLGGDSNTIEIPTSVPIQLRNFFNGCLLPHPWQRPKNGQALLKEFDVLIEGLWGPRKFHPFGMPNVTSESPFR